MLPHRWFRYTLAPHKWARCVADCLHDLANAASKAELHAHNCCLVHVVDILALDEQLLLGNWISATLPVPDFTVIDIAGPRFTRMRAK